MKKILSRAYISSKYRAKCPFCDCEFEYQLEDVSRGQMDIPYYKNKLYVDCPNCNRVLFHDDSSSTCTRLSTESL